MDYKNLLLLAVDLASKHHAGQKYGDFDYTEHLKNVQNVLIRFGFKMSNEEHSRLIISAWLHDIIEDTEFTLKEVENMFGKEIANIVWSVTNEPSANRKEKLQKTYFKLKQNSQAILLKLADRISNTEQSIAFFNQDNGKMLKKYKQEHPEFKKNLYDPSCTESKPMWEHLDKILS